MHVEEVRRRVNKTKDGDKEYTLSDFGTSKKILEELNCPNYHDLKNMVFRMQLTYDETMDVLDINYFSPERTS